jgi:hypothetical protein
MGKVEYKKRQRHRGAIGKSEYKKGTQAQSD